MALKILPTSGVECCEKSMCWSRSVNHDVDKTKPFALSPGLDVGVSFTNGAFKNAISD